MDGSRGLRISDYLSKKPHRDIFGPSLLRHCTRERAAQEAGLRLLADAQVHELELRELRLQLAASEHRNSQLSRSLAR